MAEFAELLTPLWCAGSISLTSMMSPSISAYHNAISTVWLVHSDWPSACGCRAAIISIRTPRCLTRFPRAWWWSSCLGPRSWPWGCPRLLVATFSIGTFPNQMLSMCFPLASALRALKTCRLYSADYPFPLGLVGMQAKVPVLKTILLIVYDILNANFVLGCRLSHFRDVRAALFFCRRQPLQ